MFYKPDECGLDFSGVPILFSAARFVLARLVFFFIIVFASSSRFFFVLHPFFPVSFLLTRNSFKIMQIRHPCHYFFALPRREANFCTNRSALKINVGWRHFILREKRSIAAPSYLGIERLSRTLLPRFYDRPADLCVGHGIKNHFGFTLHSRPYTDTTKR